MQDLAGHWALDPHVRFLNHGSFGACPTAVLERQSELRRRMEAEPVRFFVREAPDLLERARVELAAFVGADPADLALVTNATIGVNTVLRSLSLGPQDGLLAIDQGYNACTNALRYVADRSGARVDVVALPFPIASEDEAVDAVLAGVRKDTRLALVDHITSPTGMVLPIERIVAGLHERGVEVLVDGAHAVGQVPLDLDGLGAEYYTSNAHKWLCTPKGAALLHVRRDKQAGLRPLSISHGANAPLGDEAQRFGVEFGWTGTDDPTAGMCIPESIAFLRGLFDGGFDGLRRHNHELVMAVRARLCAALGVEPPCPESMIGSLAAVPIPPGPPREAGGAFALDALHERLFQEHGIEVPVSNWPSPEVRLLRVSAQAYNQPSDYDSLIDALPGLLADEQAQAGAAT